MKLEWVGQSIFPTTGSCECGKFNFSKRVVDARGVCNCVTSPAKVGAALAAGAGLLWLVLGQSKIRSSNPTFVPTTHASSDRKQFTDSLPDIISKGDVLTLSSEKKVIARRIVGRGTRVEVYDEELDDVYTVPLKHVIGVSFR